MKTIALAIALVAMRVVTTPDLAAADTVLRTPFLEASGTSEIQCGVTNLSKKTIDVQRTIAARSGTNRNEKCRFRHRVPQKFGGGAPFWGNISW